MTENPFDLSGKVAVVTGASPGLGQYLGRALARAGADLIVTSRRQADLQNFKKEIEALGRRAVPLELDLRGQASLASDASAYVTGQTLLVDGGISTGATKASL